MLNILSAACFAGLLALVVLVKVVRSRRTVSALIAYCLAVSFGAGLTQHDAWPFAKWPMAGGRADARASNTRVVGLDAAGGEHAIDYRAWQPLGFDELIPWMHLTFPRLSRPEQDQAAAFLLGVAEGARQRALAGGGVGRFHRFLGPLSAPYFDLHPRLWPAGRIPTAPLRGLRVYQESWSQEERRRDPARVDRSLVYEYRVP